MLEAGLLQHTFLCTMHSKPSNANVADSNHRCSNMQMYDDALPDLEQRIAVARTAA
jgi:hypothetical protein